MNEKKYNDDMERMEEKLATFRQAQEAEENVQDGFKRKADQAVVFLEETFE